MNTPPPDLLNRLKRLWSDEGVAPSNDDVAPVLPAPTPLAETVLEALEQPVVVVAATNRADPSGRRIAYANPAARSVLRIRSDPALLAASIRDPDLLEAVDAALFDGVESAVDMDTGGVQTQRWRVSVRPLSGPAGSEVLAMLSMRDETDAHRIEMTRVDFLANASHELRTPLASLTGFIETLKGPARDDAKARDRFLDIMAAQTDRMGRLVSDLLSLSRIELNERIPPSGEVDLAGVAADVVDALSVIAERRGVTLTLDQDGDAVVNGDRDQLVQVLQNLAENALKYSPDGGGIEIVLRGGLTGPSAAQPTWPEAARLPLLTPELAAGARYVSVSVRDHGPGMARQYMPRLTERFYRVEGQKSGDRLGTGLGLAIVKHIVNRHRGGLAVESEPGQGAAFTAWFPTV